MTQKDFLVFLERIFCHWIFEINSVSILIWVFNLHFELALTESLGRHNGAPPNFYTVSSFSTLTGDDNLLSPSRTFFDPEVTNLYMLDCSGGKHPEVGSVESCYKQIHKGIFTEYEGLVNFQNSPIRVFVSEGYLEEPSIYRFVRTSERRIPSLGRVIRVFEATRI
jgi:hypothetical protein